MKGQMGGVGKGVSPEWLIDAADAVTLKSAVDGLVGIKVDMANSQGGSEIDFGAMTGSDFATISNGLSFWGSNSANTC